MNMLISRLVPAVVLWLPLPAPAQAAGAAVPVQTKAPDSAWRWQSAFSDYKPWRDIQPGNWRELNDRLAPVPASAPLAPADKAPAPAAPHHHMHGEHR